jgi:Protein required for attachment to host cells
MAMAPLIVVADRGVVKAYEIRHTAKHGTAARLISERKLEEAHERYRDKVTDQAGAFPSTGTGGHGNAIAERPKMEAEEDTRLFKSISQQIEAVIRQHQPVSWSLAAPAEINSAILQYIPADLQKTLEQNVKHDLTKIPAASLGEHFAWTAT